MVLESPYWEGDRLSSQVWSYSSATETLYEGEGEEDTDSFDRFNAGDISLNEYREQSNTLLDFSWNLVDQCVMLFHQFCKLIS